MTLNVQHRMTNTTDNIHVSEDVIHSVFKLDSECCAPVSRWEMLLPRSERLEGSSPDLSAVF